MRHSSVKQFNGSSELSVGEWVLVGGLGVEVKVLDDERSSTPYRQGPLQCLTYLLLFPFACPLQAV